MNHLQEVILSIAKDIDKICRKNNIEYYLLGGSSIGAVRHKGFIPWDDDFDIVMNNDNYSKFIKVCREQLDTNKYYFQEGLNDWPLNFSKVKLKGTHLKEYEGFVKDDNADRDGIYVDVFKLDNVSNNKFVQLWQYICAKYYLCYTLSVRTYKSASFKKRLMMFCAYPMRLGIIRKFIIRQTTKYNNKTTNYYGLFYGRTRYKTSITAKWVYGKPTYVDFEDTQFPIEEHYHEYLTQMFGDYMKLPPIEQRKGLHLISVDFGKY